MKQHIFVLILAFALVGCDRTSSEEMIGNLSGYWEIQQAELPEGITKEFRFSELVDYIEVDSSKGFRTKVRPQLDGSFISTDAREIFEIRVEQDSIHLYYSTPYNQWKETLISSSEDQIKILNSEGIIYTYKRFTPYSGNYGQETE